MPIRIVNAYRSLYDEFFEPATRHPLANTRVKVPCFKSANGFADSFIAINFGGEKHPKIWAANCVKPDGKNVYHGSIQINPDLLKAKPELIKMTLAEEWLEVMVGIRDKGEGRMQKLVDDKASLILLFNSLAKRGLWQDSTEQHNALHSALRELLVPKQFLDRVGEECGLTLETMGREMKVSPNVALGHITTFVKTYASKHTVEIDLVYDRLMEVLGL